MAQSSRYLAKISDQARELGEMHKRLATSSQYSELLEAKLKNVENSVLTGTANLMNVENYPPQTNTSEAATRRRIQREHREKLDSMQKLLETSELRLTESQKSKAKLLSDMETITRENRHLAKQCTDLQRENQRMRAELEATSRLVESKSFLTATSSSKAVFGTREEILRLKHDFENSQNELSKARIREQELLMNNKILEEALEFRVDEIGLSGQADLLAKVAALRGEVSALKAELLNKREELHDTETEKQEMGSRHEALQRQISLMQQKLKQSQEDLTRLQRGDIVDQLKTAEQERDCLLEFVQSDMEKSATIAAKLEAVESGLKIAKQSEVLLENRAKVAEKGLEEQMAKARQIMHEKSSIEIRVDELEKEKEVLREQVATMQLQVVRKGSEAQELSNMQGTILSQVMNA